MVEVAHLPPQSRTYKEEPRARINDNADDTSVVGKRVCARWHDGFWYKGTVKAVRYSRDQQTYCTVLFENGFTEELSTSLITGPGLSDTDHECLTPGQRVHVRHVDRWTSAIVVTNYTDTEQMLVELENGERLRCAYADVALILYGRDADDTTRQQRYSPAGQMQHLTRAPHELRHGSPAGSSPEGFQGHRPHERALPQYSPAVGGHGQAAKPRSAVLAHKESEGIGMPDDEAHPPLRAELSSASMASQASVDPRRIIHRMSAGYRDMYGAPVQGAGAARHAPYDKAARPPDPSEQRWAEPAPYRRPAPPMHSPPMAPPRAPRPHTYAALGNAPSYGYNDTNDAPRRYSEPARPSEYATTYPPTWQPGMHSNSMPTLPSMSMARPASPTHPAADRNEYRYGAGAGDNGRHARQPPALQAPRSAPAMADVGGEYMKCRKRYGLERKSEWCAKCRWKKKCERIPAGHPG